MEAIKQIVTSKGVMGLIEPTIKAFAPLLQSRRGAIESTTRKTFQFGATERQSLDVYYPELSSDSPKPPILLFFYGGGLTYGNRIFPAPLDLVFKNCGAFFASRGILTVIPDYRLAPQAVYPEPVEDLRDAFRYVIANLGDAGDTKRVYLTGHSVGGSLLLSMLLSENPRFIEHEELKRHVKGIVPRGAGCAFDLIPPPVVSVYHTFYGSQEKSVTLSPLGLLKEASQKTLDALPPMLIIQAEDEPPFVSTPLKGFNALFEERTGKKIEVKVAEGHNHISVNMALNSGEGEQWGEELVKWVKDN
ncbi:alpha/beta-hydrolase [Schizopora paradoxa]|uniref:Alpha/beta-hydrolase n=1 Tax=Schizopora paradoxa TaxID=27342 RepID=A0A0H2RD01_9AGAM|nr:alpha/beta-hydrolase [Schizopora paradoxa]